MEKMTFTKAIVQFFGKKPGQSTSELMQEIKALTDSDRAHFAKEFAKVGVEIVAA